MKQMNRKKWSKTLLWLGCVCAATFLPLGQEISTITSGKITLKEMSANAQSTGNSEIAALSDQQKLRQAEEMRRYALELVNQDRRARGLSPLVRDPIAEQAAQLHAQDMLQRQFFDHRTPEGSKPRDRYRMVGGNPRTGIGENIYWIENPALRGLSFSLAQHLQRGWMNSPGHRENILTANYTGFGYGIAFGPGGTIYAVQNFTSLPQ
jgi:uncharacterized protein YkwD